MPRISQIWNLARRAARGVPPPHAPGLPGGEFAVEVDAISSSPASVDDVFDVDFPGCLAREFPREFPIAWSATEETVARLQNVDLGRLAHHSPGLRGFQWETYLRLSAARICRMLRALGEFTPRGGQVLDYGAYFGNFAVAASRAGYRVTAIDSYAAYAPALVRWVAWLRENSVVVDDFARAGYELEPAMHGAFDAVLAMGVIEHVPHTPRPLLEALDNALQAGGLLVLDTPNLAYLHRRRQLANGDSVFCPIELQYDTAIPFEGHHREYTGRELAWMLGKLRHEVLRLERFDYSVLALSRLGGTELADFRRRNADPELRELMLSISRKPSG